MIIPFWFRVKVSVKVQFVDQKDLFNNYSHSIAPLFFSLKKHLYKRCKNERTMNAIP